MSDKRAKYGPDTREWGWVPDTHRPHEWQPPERAIRRFAELNSRTDTNNRPNIYKPGRENWHRLATLVIQSGETLAAFDCEERDELSFHLSCSVWLEDDEIDFDLRTDFIEAVTRLYERGAVKLGSEASSEYMLFDNLAGCSFRNAWRDGKPILDGRLLAIQDVLLAAMLRVLALDDPGAQEAALHGLGHLAHEGARPAIEAFMERIEDDKLREYAKEAWAFTVH